MDKPKCKDCGQDWEKVLTSGRCARCQVKWDDEHPNPSPKHKIEFDDMEVPDDPR